MAKTNYLRNKILDHWLGGPDYARPANLYFALYTAAPTVAGTDGTEVVGGSYARVAATNNTTNFPAAVTGGKSNAVAVTFPAATAGWGTVVAVAIFDAASGGNMLDFAVLTTPKAVGNGDVFSFSIGQLVFQED